MKRNFVFLTAVFIISSLFLSNANTQKADPRKDKLIGNLLKSALESYHFKGMKIGDEVSEKAFKEFIKKIDPSKQYFTEEDVKSLEVYKLAMDDQMSSGSFELIEKTMAIMKKRIQFAENIRKKSFQKQFDFSGNEAIELDPEKRKFPKNEKELAENWRLFFKHLTLSRYMTILEEQETLKKSKASKKSKLTAKEEKQLKQLKGEKILTDKEMRDKAHELVSNRYKKILEQMLKEDRDDMSENFYNAIATIYDPHTVYMPPKPKADFDIDITGKLEGIGAVLQEDGSYIKVVQIVPGGPAWRQKELETDDTILAVAQGSGESVDLMDMKVDDAVRYIRGKKGTEVRLTIKKVDGTRKVISIIRDEIEVAASFAKSSVLSREGGSYKIGYIQLPKFYRDFENSDVNCTDDVRKELERVKKAGVQAVILDLRNNGGGALEDARLMSGLFIDKGPIVQVKNHTGTVDVLEDDNPSITYDGPLIVLINQFSASASEILAGAMQDYGRAIIVGGDFSHGKGTVQAVINLNQGPLLSLFGPTMGALKVTIQKFYRVTGASTQYKGVTPDIILPDPMSYLESREKDLEFSLPWDQINAQKFTKWNRSQPQIQKLREQSLMRVRDSQRFKRITTSVDFLTKKRKDTSVVLNLKNLQDEDAKNKKFVEELKLEDEDKKVLVTSFEDSLMAHDNKKVINNKKWKTDFELRKAEWIKSLRQDVVLGEAMLIAEDYVKQVQK